MFMKERMTYQETSEVALFNTIGKYAESKDYDVEYFKVKRPKPPTSLNFASFNLEDMEWEDMHYIHIHKDALLKYSIYFDEHSLGAIIDVPYYEMYDTVDIERYFTNTEDEIDLINKMKSLL